MSNAPLQPVLSKLSDAKRNGNGWSARCTPPKEGVDVDTNRPRRGKTPIPSTSTSEKKVYWSAGDAVAELERRYGKRSALWTYHNAHGEPVGRIVCWHTLQGKDTWPVSRLGLGWISGGMPEPRPLYRLAELDGATRVYVCEGQKAAEAAWSIGLTATTSPYGSKSAKKADWSPLAGKEVVILPDNGKAGRSYAEDVQAILSKLTPAPTLKVVDPRDDPAGSPSAGHGSRPPGKRLGSATPVVIFPVVARCLERGRHPGRCGGPR